MKFGPKNLAIEDTSRFVLKEQNVALTLNSMNKKTELKIMKTVDFQKKLHKKVTK